MVANRACRLGVGLSEPERETRHGDVREAGDLERRQPRVDRNGASPQAPNSEQIDEELRCVAVVKENTITAAETTTRIEGQPSAVALQHRRTIPVPARDWLGQRARSQIHEHTVSLHRLYPK